MSEVHELFAPPLGGPTPEEHAAALAVLEAAKLAVEEQSRNTLVRCRNFVATGKGCGAYLRVCTLTYIQTHYYISAHGCTGGDYWLPGEGAFVCPLCNHRNRLYASPRVMALKRYFKAIVEEHKD